MAGVRFMVQTDQIVTGTGVKTLLQIVAPANQRVLIKEISISFDGTSNTADPINVSVNRQTTAGTMTSITPKKVNEGDDETLQTTAQHTATVEPTTGDEILGEQVHPQGGFTWQAPFGEPIVIKGGNRLGIITNSPGATVNAKVRVIGEE